MSSTELDTILDLLPDSERRVLLEYVKRCQARVFNLAAALLLLWVVLSVVLIALWWQGGAG